MRHVAFLRAINVGGRRATNETLMAPFVGLGFRDVQAYQAAGNIVFDSDIVDVDTIEAALASEFGFDVPVFVRRADDVVRLLDDRPSLPGTGKLQVGFLRNKPAADSLGALDAIVPTEDHVVVEGRELWWMPVDGISTSTLDVARVESLVGPMTIRTVGTVERLAAKFFSGVTG